MSESTLEGGCQCGRVRYRVHGEPVLRALCHCASCRRAHAAPAVAWAMFTDSQVEFPIDAPTYYRSSAAARRGFCRVCGTPICFLADFLPGLTDLTVGSFDEPEKLPPTMHYWESKRLPWLKLADDLPRHREFPPMGGDGDEE